ncbi:hypothetical protein L9F63_023683, partial [Diploptera punctata]
VMEYGEQYRTPNITEILNVVEFKQTVEYYSRRKMLCTPFISLHAVYNYIVLA